MALVSTFFHMFIVLWMYKFEGSTIPVHMNDSSERYNLICQKNAIHCKKHKNGIFLKFHGFDFFPKMILQRRSYVFEFKF